jgi:XTP/dITP diphosphohydrolase
MTRRLEAGELVLASDNPGKVDAVARLTAGVIGKVHPLKAFTREQAEETGTTFEENATIKAVAAAKASGLPALADDSGLEVTALGGEPGVYMADWTYDGKGGRDEALGNRRILEKLEATGSSDRSAKMVTVLALAWPDGQVELVRGEVTGTITSAPRGRNGFGFDPIFKPDGDERTFAEMSDDDKKGYSARTRAFEAFVAKHLPAPKPAKADGPAVQAPGNAAR